MKISWDKKSTPYGVARDIVLEKYKYLNESIVVQFNIKYKNEKEYRRTTELLSHEYDFIPGHYWVWEYDWWEGEEDIELVAFMPVSEIDLLRMKGGDATDETD